LNIGEKEDNGRLGTLEEVTCKLAGTIKPAQEFDKRIE